MPSVKTPYLASGMSTCLVCHFKLVLLGDTAVGKSCLVVRFVRDEFFEFQEPTIGAAFLTQTVPIEGATVKFEIWDTAGQERYRSLAPMYYRGAAAAIVVYDITNKESFNGAKSWVKELQRRGDPNVVITLAGNKADLQNKRKVEHQVLSPMVSKAMSHNRKLNNMQKKMEFCIWRHRRKMPPMSKVCFKR